MWYIGTVMLVAWWIVVLFFVGIEKESKKRNFVLWLKAIVMHKYIDDAVTLATRCVKISFRMLVNFEKPIYMFDDSMHRPKRSYLECVLLSVHFSHFIRLMEIMKINVALLCWHIKSQCWTTIDMHYNNILSMCCAYIVTKTENSKNV